MGLGCGTPTSMLTAADAAQTAKGMTITLGFMGWVEKQRELHIQ